MGMIRHEETLVGGQLTLRRREGVVEVLLNRPGQRNAITEAMYDALRSVCEELERDTSTRVLVLRGAGGRAFAAGTDIAEFDGFDGPAGVAYEARIRSLLRQLIGLPQVSIAAVEGVCVGGGLALATYCDLRICTEGSQFGYPVARTLGNMVSSAVLYRCASVFGESLTREMLLASRLVDADRAYAVGAVMAVVPSAEMDEQVGRLVHGLRQVAPATLRATKEQLLAHVERHEASTADDDARIDRVYGSADFAEGVRAFLSREKPRFRGDTT